MAVYIPGAINTNNGNQQVSIPPYQELTSFHANKLLHNLIMPGVYDAEVEVTKVGSTFNFIVKAGTTLVFEREHDSETLVGKVIIQNDATIEVSETDINNISEESLLVIGSWSYNLLDSTNIYANLLVIADNLANRNEVNQNKDIIITSLLNHSVAKAGTGSDYRPAYQYQEHRDFFKHLFEINKGFPLTFAGNGRQITVGEGNVVLGDTYINNYSTLVAGVGGVWPTPVVIANPENYYQIDVLRLKTERSASSSNTTYLEWESFTKSKAGFTTVKAFIDGFDFVFKDQGYNLLYVVRDLNGLLTTTPIWPSQTLKVNPFLPQVGIPETLTRFKLPIY